MKHMLATLEEKKQRLPPLFAKKSVSSTSPVLKKLNLVAHWPITTL